MLGNSILEMGIHATDDKLLAAGLACLLEGVASKLSVITVIVLDADTVLGSKPLECLLSKDGHGGGVIDLEMHKMQTGVEIHKNSAVSVPLLGECPL